MKPRALHAGRAVPLEVRAAIRTQIGRDMFRAEKGRDPLDARELSGHIAKLSRPQTTAVAGFDLTFSPVKSVSTLWALAEPDVAAKIEIAHRAAISDALRFIETHALFSRTGTNGVRQVNVRGLVATAFTHRDSRAGDPDLHTHVAVANKVQTLDGRWLSIDGRPLYKAIVATSEMYNTSLERHLSDALGVQFAERPSTEPGKRPVREVAGVDPELNRRWSARRLSIERRQGQLAAAFQADHGRPPTIIEARVLAQQATLETRQAKHAPRHLTEQRATWRAEAEAVLGVGGIEQMVRTTLAPRRSRRPDTVSSRWVQQQSQAIVTTMEGSRARWQEWHVRAEALRIVRAAQVPTRRIDETVARLTHDALQRGSVPLEAPADGIVEPSAPAAAGVTWACRAAPTSDRGLGPDLVRDGDRRRRGVPEGFLPAPIRRQRRHLHPHRRHLEAQRRHQLGPLTSSRALSQKKSGRKGSQLGPLSLSRGEQIPT